mmetsp:Transcript_78403/g.227563  ORF Transcript_78403/g.227563 Transcript_78403/m.227563 type:complete len:231 (-) Transcript_78403:30-722(-)
MSNLPRLARLTKELHDLGLVPRSLAVILPFIGAVIAGILVDVQSLLRLLCREKVREAVNPACGDHAIIPAEHELVGVQTVNLRVRHDLVHDIKLLAEPHLPSQAAFCCRWHRQRLHELRRRLEERVREHRRCLNLISDGLRLQGRGLHDYGRGDRLRDNFARRESGCHRCRCGSRCGLSKASPLATATAHGVVATAGPATGQHNGAGANAGDLHHGLRCLWSDDRLGRRS